MKNHILLTVAIIGASIAPAQAITFASGKGADSATCGAIASPCRTLQRAVTNAPAGGYVVLQDAADFGPATIEKALTVTGENGATIRADSTVINNGRSIILIYAGANDVVRLRRLSIKDAPTGVNGVEWVRGKRLEIEDCNLDQGVHATGSQLLVTDTIFAGVWSGSSSKFTSFYDSVNFRTGIWAGWGGYETAILLNSSISGAEGLRNFGSENEIVLRNTTISGARTALDPGGAALFLSRSTITGNTAAMSSLFSGALLTFGDNLIRGNGDNTLTRVVPTNYQ